MKFKKLTESVNSAKDKFVLYFPYLEPKIIDKERAIKQLEFELDQIKNSSGASLAGRGFGIYCLESYDEDTGTSWTGRYTSKEFLKVISEDIDRSLEEDLEDERDLLLAAGDYKCRLTRYDIEEAADWKMLMEYIKTSYDILKEEFGDNLRMWSFYEDDDSDMINGYKVWLKDGTKHIVEINNERVDIVEELELKEEDEPIKFIIIAVDNDGNRLFYNGDSNTFVDSHKDATIYDEHDDAIDAWHKIDKKKYKRVFVPNYDPAMFEAVNKQLNEEATEITYELDDSSLTISKDSHVNGNEKVSTVTWSKTKNGKEVDSFSGTRTTDISKLTETVNDEYETDYRYYVYDSTDRVVSDGFEYDDDAIEFALNNNYPLVKIHNYYRDDDGSLNPDGDPEVIWTAE